MSPDRAAQALRLVALEAQYLDEREWDRWLELYAEDAVFWVPAWRDELHLVEDPYRELSFMYLEGRALLAERVQRVRSGRSIASLPPPRTAHLVAGSVAEGEGDEAVVKSAWCSQVYHHKDAALVSYAGRYEHRLAWVAGAWRIRRKKITVINDQLQSMVDFFYL
jgi:3-phenylpropionate/cinnamic acid dioxygenase small subunit